MAAVDKTTMTTPRVHVIHDPSRMDRSVPVGRLYELYPDIVWQRAIRVPWERDKVSSSVRGCALAHLEAIISGPPGDVLVFEDDAACVPEYLDVWNRYLSSHIPDEADIVILGGEKEKVGPSDVWGFRRVLPPMWGSHAVLYRKSAIDKGFVFHAYKIMAEQHLGEPDGVCYESVIIQAANRCGCGVFRPSHMPFSTTGGMSSRSQTSDPPRDRWLHMPMTRPVAPSMCVRLKDDLWATLNTRCASTSMKALHAPEGCEDPHKAVGWAEVPGVLEVAPDTERLLMVVRDPVERFISTILWLNGKKHPHLPDMGLDVDAWIDRAEFELETCPPETQDEHLRRQCDHKALPRVRELVWLEDLDHFLSGKGIDLPRLAGRGEGEVVLTREQEDRVKVLYARDYEMLSMLDFELNKHKKSHANSTEQ